MHPDARTLIDRLSLVPQPEGGFYRETFRASITVEGTPHGGRRSASTAIYYLLPAGTFAAWHRVASDEAWHFYDGDPLELHTINPRSGVHTLTVLGRDVAAGQFPQHVVAAGTWQAARPRGERFTLTGCTVAPGFESADFELPSRAVLQQLLPGHDDLVIALTRA
jgi:predicted cupin superfamily sugar epimerase